MPLFLWVSDEIWAKLGMDKKDFLCDICLIERLRGIATAAFIVLGEGKHTIIPAAAEITMEQNKNKELLEKRKSFYDS